MSDVEKRMKALEERVTWLEEWGSPSSQNDRKAKLIEAAKLIKGWMNEPGDYDEEVARILMEGEKYRVRCYDPRDQASAAVAEAFLNYTAQSQDDTAPETVCPRCNQGSRKPNENCGSNLARHADSTQQDREP